MPPKRPKALKWTGKHLPDGRPEMFINTVEPRDYDEDETALLNNDQLTDARHSGLYREVHAPEPKRKSVVAKNATTEPEPEPVADEPAAEPAVEEGE